MFLKKIFAFIVAHLLFFSGTNTKVYVAPEQPKIPPVVNPIQLNDKPKTTVATTTKATTTPVAKPSPIIKPIPKPVILPTLPVMPTLPTPVTLIETPPDFEKINTFARPAIVNILCSTKGGALSPISGTGIVVGSDGLILTNAHIGQYFLLKDFREPNFLECIARTGSPAYPKYHLELVYISPTWVGNNKGLLKEQNPQGTGENDFAFLRITDAINGSALPSPIPYIPMDVRENINTNENVLLVSYPAGFLGGLSILQDLSITSAITQVHDVFTFKDGTVDLISVPGTVVSQKGSSGGAVVDKNSSLIGVISTSSNGDTTSSRDLRAITLAYINRDLQTELGMNLAQFANLDHANFAQVFARTNAPTLTKIISDELNK